MEILTIVLVAIVGIGFAIGMFTLTRLLNRTQPAQSNHLPTQLLITVNVFVTVVFVYFVSVSKSWALAIIFMIPIAALWYWCWLSVKRARHARRPL
jgi:hypothetical protein